MVSITNAFARQTLDALDDLANAGAGAAVLRTYDGTPPANIDAALSGNNLLAENTMATPSAFGAAADDAGNNRASLTAGSIADDASGNASGTPTFCRIFDSDSNAVAQLTAGVGSGEVNFGAAIVAGQPVQITSIVIYMNEG